MYNTVSMNAICRLRLYWTFLLTFPHLESVAELREKDSQFFVMRAREASTCTRVNVAYTL